MTYAEAGDYSLVVTNSSSFANRSLGLYVTGNALYAESSGGTPILNLLPNAWYNLQLTLDTSAPVNTYSGTVTPYGGDGITYAISSRSFLTATRRSTRSTATAAAMAWAARLPITTSTILC